MEQVLQHFKERIVSATADKTALQLRGGGTKDWYGQQPTGEMLDTRSYRGIVAYDPTELAITARCGTPLSEIENVLAEQNQMLAFEPPHFSTIAPVATSQKKKEQAPSLSLWEHIGHAGDGTGATIGGVVASGLSGPRRSAVGAVRDFMLGAVLMDGKGEVLHFGGQVMKNVAGYDVSRLLAGSLGTLGLILQVSLKVLPKPIAQSTRCFSMDQIEAIRRLNEWGGQPLPISASVWRDEMLTIRLSGAQAAVSAAEKKLGGTLVSNADVFWQTQREQSLVDQDTPLWRLSVPSTTPVIALPGSQWMEWGGAQRWLQTGVDAHSVRAAVEAIGGHATLFKGGDKRVGVFHPLAPAVATIHRKLKKSFDPAGIFNPGRMYMDY